ncbi:MAG: hypothetical protein JO232_18260 [Verrucomicrobia bacterium]|nr:hypothetical protein [Verrucomicrobiota bacterium]
MPIRLALLREYHIREPRPEFLNAMAEHDDADQQIAGGCSEEAAGEYIQKLKSDKRYQRDVY